MSSENIFLSRLNAVAAETETLLDRLLGTAPIEGECTRPKRLLDSIRYASLGGGKRFRPFLVVEAAALFGVARERAMMAGAALECVHCYSLVHDDLPAMDNDDLRRGRPTAHKAFDDATAILAGDGLLTLAFDIVTRDEVHEDPTVRLLLTRALARAAGIGGMVGGQMLDLAGEGRFVLRGTLGQLSARLDPASFLRISRSLVVNVTRIKSAHWQDNGQCELVMADGLSLRSSRRYRRDVMGFLDRGK